MRPRRLTSPLHRSLSWLLWLALLMPVAQSAAAWHAYSHGLQEAGEHGGDAQAPHAFPCDLCLAAAAVSGGALHGALPALVLAAARHEAPRVAAGSAWQSRFTPAYRSRAPPPVLR